MPQACLTTHVLDLTTGQPAVGIGVDLYHCETGSARHLRHAQTNADGRLDRPLLSRDDPTVRPGRYRLDFDVKTPLFDGLPIVFHIENTAWHHHVPLVIAPFGFSTYRGAPPSHAPAHANRPAQPRSGPAATGQAPPPGAGGAGVTIHAIDIAQGCGAAGLQVDLIGPEGQRINRQRTTAEGRTPRWLAPAGSLRPGQYRLIFHLGDYYRASGLPVGSNPFFPVAIVPFAIDDPERHYHIPLLAAPWGYSCYRGS